MVKVSQIVKTLCNERVSISQYLLTNAKCLLIEWLNELIYLFDTERVLFKRFDVGSISNNQCKATCYGEEFNPLRHKIKIEVKAATYHMAKIDKDDNGYTAQIILDI